MMKMVNSTRLKLGKPTKAQNSYHKGENFKYGENFKHVLVTIQAQHPLHQI